MSLTSFNPSTAGLAFLALCVIALLFQNRHLRVKLEQAGDDLLTGLPLRAKFLAAVEVLFGAVRAKKFGVSQHRRRADLTNGAHDLTVLLFDIDFFKRVNDTFGHDEGDRVLALLGQILKAQRRAGDLVCRWGGEEFLVALLTDTRGAELYYKRVSDQFRLQSKEALGYACTLTAGAVQLELPEHSFDDLVKIADKCLYSGKKMRHCLVYRLPGTENEVVCDHDDIQS